MVYNNYSAKRTREMDCTSMDHYEKQLYTVFKTFDVDNEEALDRSAVLQLCDTLQLEDRGAALVDTLFERQADRVTFAQFRNGLLSVLGGEPASHTESATGTEDSVDAAVPVASPSHSDEDSSGREVAPKFVFGSKRYGRRSRPQRNSPEESPRHRVASESRIDSSRTKQRMRCKRSASAMESRDDSVVDDDAVDLDHDRRVDRERALALCRGLHMHGVDRNLVDRIFEAAPNEEITVGEFFDRLNASLTTSIAASLDGVMTGEGSKVPNEVISSDAVVEAWERAGVQRPRRLLIELGFVAAALRPHELERALEDELRALATPPDAAPDAGALLLLAAHTLARMRLESSWRLSDVVRAERDKLREDLAEANRRARLLAQDIDDNHARIEAELKSSLRQVETRHAEAARIAAAEAAAERERAAAAQSALEDETARRVEAEARLRAETTSLRERIEELQELARGGEERAAAAERERAQAETAAREAAARGAGALEAARAEAAELRARVCELRGDNQRLRDRGDELCAALEAAARRERPRASAAPSWRDEVGMHGAPDEPHSPDKLQNKTLQANERRTFDLRQSVEKLKLIFKSIEGLPSPNREECSKCGRLNEIVTELQRAIQELDEQSGLTDTDIPLDCKKIEVSLQTETEDTEDVETLRRDLSDIKYRHEMDKQNLTSVIRELESSLEQMKLEYDRCEEYWAAKLQDERDMLAEEQRAGDERLAELAAKIGDYERQFARPVAPLATITEYSLELQFNDLQDEFVRYRREKEEELGKQGEEIKRLTEKVEDLERRQASAAAAHERRGLVLCAAGAGAGGGGGGGGAAGEGGGGGGGGGCACAARWRAAAAAREAGALRARAARAERAAQRLHARLAAADLLVKDLYIENCRLAHLPHLPRLP